VLQEHNYTVWNFVLIDHNYTAVPGRIAVMESTSPPSADSSDCPLLFPVQCNSDKPHSPDRATNVIETECSCMTLFLPLQEGTAEVCEHRDTAAAVENSDQYRRTYTESVLQAEDPELEDYYKAVTKPVTQFTTPLAAWVLVSIFLLSYIHKNATDSIIGEMSQLYAIASVNGHKRNKPYSKQLMIFCLTLAGYSAKAYSYLRSVAKKCIPTPETLKRYRNRVDGSPGFSLAALKMIKSKVAEMADNSKKLFLSLSCDDISIRAVFL
jgi:hypothetical protein